MRNSKKHKRTSFQKKGCKEELNVNKDNLLEEQAMNLLKDGKVIEAEKVYKELISKGTKNYIVYGNLAVLLGINGNINQMIELLKKALDYNPYYAEGFYNLGNAYEEKGFIEDSIICYRKALKIKENYIEAEYNLANLLKKQGDIISSIKGYEKVLKIKPNFFPACASLGNALKESGEKESAVKYYNKALQIKSDSADVLINLGNLLLSNNELKEATDLFIKAISIDSNYAEAHYNLGIIYLRQKNYDNAVNSFNFAIKLNPSLTEAYNNLGTAKKGLNQLQDAIICYKNAIKLNPYFSEAYNNLGVALKSLDDIDNAILCYRKALLYKSDYPEAYNNLGNALLLKDLNNEASENYKKAIEINTNYAEAYNNLGTALQQIGNINEAINSFKKALEINPNEADAHWNLSILQLYLGDYESGWKNYDWRGKNKNPIKPHAKPNIPKWQGEELKEKDKLLIVSEQGLGDSIQFMRYIKCLREKNINVSFCAQEKLHTIIKDSEIDENPLTADEGNQISEGKWVSLLSLPMYLKINPNNPIISGAYIKTNEKLKNKWKEILYQEKKIIIGINWQGNPEAEKRNMKGRSIPLENFNLITKQSNVKLVSLQKGFGSDQMQICSFKDKFVSCQNEINNIWDFQETAAIIANCDLVITSDTAIAHLAGGMGKKTWVLLKNLPEWRWGNQGNKTFWYTSTRLFRQKESYNWKEVFYRVSLALDEFIHDKE